MCEWLNFRFVNADNKPYKSISPDINASYSTTDYALQPPLLLNVWLNTIVAEYFDRIIAL